MVPLTRWLKDRACKSCHAPRAVSEGARRHFSWHFALSCLPRDWAHLCGHCISTSFGSGRGWISESRSTSQHSLTSSCKITCNKAGHLITQWRFRERLPEILIASPQLQSPVYAERKIMVAKETGLARKTETLSSLGSEDSQSNLGCI